MTSVFAWKRYSPLFGAAGRFLEYFKTINLGIHFSKIQALDI